jgi:DNA repair protein RecO (recombination protein O)
VLKESEAIVLRSYPLREADLLVSFFTRAEGKVKGVARAAKKSKRRFGGALEPLTHVRLYWEDRERTELARIDSCEVISSPLSETVDYPRAVALAHIAELLDELLPDRQHDDPIFRLTLAVLPHIHAEATPLARSPKIKVRHPAPVIAREPHTGARHPAPAVGAGSGNAPASNQSQSCRLESSPVSIWLPLTYFDLWLCRLTGLLPSLSECSACSAELNGHRAFFHPMAEGLLCTRDKRLASTEISADSRALAAQMLRAPLADLLSSDRPTTNDQRPMTFRDLRRLLTHIIERHIEKNLVTATMLDRLNG